MQGLLSANCPKPPCLKLQFTTVDMNDHQKLQVKSVSLASRVHSSKCSNSYVFSIFYQFELREGFFFFAMALEFTLQHLKYNQTSSNKRKKDRTSSLGDKKKDPCTTFFSISSCFRADVFFFIFPIFLRQRMRAELSTAALLINFAHPSYEAPSLSKFSIFATIISLERPGRR